MDSPTKNSENGVTEEVVAKKQTTPPKDASNPLKDVSNPPKDSSNAQIIKWGLGRGVNVTKRTPWLEKTSFQVRTVREDSIIETDDGGLLKAYTEEVRSKTTVNSEVQAGIRPANVPLNVRMDVEYTRSALSAKYVVGKKIKTRTIAFRADITDVPTTLAKDMAEAKEILSKFQIPRELAPPTSSLTPASPDGQGTPPTDYTFEDSLKSWVMNCLKHNGYTCQDSFEETLVDLKEEKDVLEHIQQSLSQFVKKFGVTHYVSSIELGALEYQELTQKEYIHHAKVSSEASVSAAAYGGIMAKTTQHLKKAVHIKASEKKMIGKIEEDAVKPEDEAVIGCLFSPITGLIKMPYLQQALKKSIDDYVFESTKGDGPYFIVFGDDLDKPKYIAVDHENASGRILYGTENMKEAEGFMVKLIEDDSRNRLEFSLTSSFPKHRNAQKETEGESKEARNAPTPLQYYLVTRVNAIGGGYAPVMRMDSKAKNVRLKLKQRINPSISSDTNQWRKEREAYYIMCVHKPRGGYLCAKPDEDRPDKGKYEVCIKPTINHCEGKQYMLFRLRRFTLGTNNGLKDNSDARINARTAAPTAAAAPTHALTEETRM